MAFIGPMIGLQSEPTEGSRTKAFDLAQKIQLSNNLLTHSIPSSALDKFTTKLLDHPIRNVLARLYERLTT